MKKWSFEADADAVDDFVYFLKALGVFAVLGFMGVIAYAVISGISASDNPGDPSVYHQIFPAHLSADLMPGQGWTVQNSQYTSFEIQSEYPVSVLGGDCSYPRGAQIELRCAPTDLQINDLRPELLVWAHSNHVSITAR
jgi:hypothetical protein